MLIPVLIPGLPAWALLPLPAFWLCCSLPLPAVTWFSAAALRRYWHPLSFYYLIYRHNSSRDSMSNLYRWNHARRDFNGKKEAIRNSIFHLIGSVSEEHWKGIGHLIRLFFLPQPCKACKHLLKFHWTLALGEPGSCLHALVLLQPASSWGAMQEGRGLNAPQLLFAKRLAKGRMKARVLKLSAEIYTVWLLIWQVGLCYLCLTDNI